MESPSGRSRGAEHTKRLLYFLLRLGVESRCGFIQHLICRGIVPNTSKYPVASQCQCAPPELSTPTRSWRPPAYYILLLHGIGEPRKTLTCKPVQTRNLNGLHCPEPSPDPLDTSGLQHSHTESSSSRLHAAKDSSESTETPLSPARPEEL